LTIRKRIEEAVALARAGYADAALTLTLVAIAAASRKKYTKAEIREDGKAFKKYLEARITQTLTDGAKTEGAFLTFPYKGKEVTIAEVLYTDFRCNLIHEASLPSGVRLDSSSNEMSFTLGGTELVLGRGWLQILINAVVNDPNLRHMFDGVRQKSASDLAFEGPDNEEEFLSSFMKDFYLSPLRVHALKTFVAAVGVDNLKRMPNDDLRSLWNEQVANDPGRFRLQSCDLRALCRPYTTVSAPDLDEPNDVPFTPSTDGTRCMITDIGIRMVRLLLSSYSGP
jgi:hypothetical protein